MVDKVLFYGIRHGETAYNNGNRFRGWTEVPLTKKGIEEAVAVGKVLSTKSIGKVLHSGLSRSKRTAEEIAKKQSGHEVEVAPTKLLLPWNMGIFSGKEKNDENLKKLQYYIDHVNTPIPKGESLSNFRSRVVKLLYQLVKEYDPKFITVLSTHTSVLRELAELVNGNDKTGIVKPGGIIAIVDHDGELRIKPIFKPDTTSDEVFN